MALVAGRVAGESRPLLGPNGAVRVLEHERPDGPARRVLLGKVPGVFATKPVGGEDHRLPAAVVVGQAGKIDLSFVAADDRLGSGDHRGKEGDRGQQADKY